MPKKGEVISSGLLVSGYFAFVMSGTLGIDTGNNMYYFIAIGIIIPSLIHSRWHFNKYHSKKQDDALENKSESQGGKK